MPTIEQIEQWLTEIAPLIRAAQLRRTGENTWFFDLDEYADLEVHRDESGHKLVITTTLGQPYPGEEANTYRMLLTLNGLWADTGGLRMALDGPGGEVEQIYDVPLPGLEKDLLQARLENFLAAAQQWRVVITSKSREGLDETSPLDAGDMIRI